MPAAVKAAALHPSDLVSTIVNGPAGSGDSPLALIAFRVLPSKLSVAPGKLLVESTAATLMTPRPAAGDPVR